MLCLSGVGGTQGVRVRDMFLFHRGKETKFKIMHVVWYPRGIEGKNFKLDFFILLKAGRNPS